MLRTYGLLRDVLLSSAFLCFLSEDTATHAQRIINLHIDLMQNEHFKWLLDIIPAAKLVCLNEQIELHVEL